MEYRAIKKYKKKHRSSYVNIIKQNPGILLGISIPFVIVTSISVKNAAAMSVEMLIISAVAALTAYFTAGRLQMWLCSVINVGVCTVVMMLTRALITALIPDIMNYLGIYIYLMAINGVVLMLSETWSGGKRPSLLTAVRTVFLQALFFCILMFAFSALREYFGNGTLWGIPVAAPVKLSGIRLPFFGFIMMGFLIAISRFVLKRFASFRIREAMRREKYASARYTRIRVDVD